MPIKNASRLDNIYLAALCSSDNFKQTGCSEDDILEALRRELHVLERDGIIVSGDLHLNVALFDISADNLGANVLFGFSGGFNAEYFCRFCTCTKEETQHMITENVSKRRTTLQYDREIKRLESNPDLDLKSTKGIRKIVR